MSNFRRSASLNRRTSAFGIPKGLPQWDHWASQNFYILVTVGPLITFILAISCGYFYFFPKLGQAFQGYSTSRANGSTGSCDVFSGSWVLDDSYPLYNSSNCPFVERGFNCLANGRKDSDYLKWRWKPKHCNIPRFNVSDTLEMLRGKRISFVGDSMSRTQWESMVCLLMTGVEDKKYVYEVNGNKITKTTRYLGVRFSSFNLTVEFFRSVFLVQTGLAPQHGPKRVKSTLILDKLDEISKEWTNSDVLIFNTGHWWVPSKLFQAGCYFQFGGSLRLGMSIATAFKIALTTWASWVDTTIKAKKTNIFFRTFEPSHWSYQSHAPCNVTQFPMSDSQGNYQSPFSDTIADVMKNMTAPVTILQITSMSAFRSDAHVGIWNDHQAVADCSHWCLPGVPDMWNEIVLFYLFSNSELALQ
ncbi:hypothetical protein Ancab_002931 [Ancistrocladus abbreviatus]